MKVISFFMQYWGSSSPERIQYARRMVIGIVIASILGGITNTALIALLNSAAYQIGNYVPSLLWTYIGFVVLVLVARFSSEILFNFLLLNVMVDLQTNLSRQILSTPLRKLEQIGAPRLSAILSNDVKTIGDAFLAFVTICLHATVVLMSLLYMAWLSWQLALLVVVFLIVGMLGYQFIVDRANPHIRRARQAYDRLFTGFRTMMEGNKELKLHSLRRRDFVEDTFKPAANEYRHANLMTQFIYNGAADWGEVLYFIVIGLVVFGAPVFLNLPTQVLSGYVLIILFMIGPLTSVIDRIAFLGQGDASVEQVESLGLSLTERIDAAPTTDRPALLPPATTEAAWQKWEIQGVTHNYTVEQQAHPFVLGPINLTFTPGQIVFIIGGNGSGKTTLAKLLLGLYLPESGQILIDDKPVTDENRDDYRQLFSAVFVDFYLFEQLLGLESSTLSEDARDYLAKLELDHKVEIQDGKLSTTDLSQGQRKRLALLTAYLENRPIYLFDEWAANQDPIFRTVFYTQLLPDLKARGKTVIVITHDDHYFSVADRLIKLDYGQIEFDSATQDAQSTATFMATMAQANTIPDTASRPIPSQKKSTP